jgi:hypothetical protein
MSAECDGLLEGSDEDFAIRTGSQMPANLSTNVRGKLVVNISRQLPEKICAMALAMRMGLRK